MKMLRIAGAWSVAATLLAGCTFGSPSPSPMSGLAASPNAGAKGKIQHIVYVIQEGRSFNTLFEGYPGAHTTSSGETSNGKRVALQPISLKTRYRIDDSAQAMFEACNGTDRRMPGTNCRMNGFNREATYGAPKRLKYPQYVYVNHNDVKPYFAMAQEWVLADEMFASNLDGGFVAHQYAIAAQAHHAVDLPTGRPCDVQSSIPRISAHRRIGGLEPACFDYQTLGGELEAAHLSWRYYQTKESEYGYKAIEKFYRHKKYRQSIAEPPSRFLSDVANGSLATFTWVTPTCADSDEVACGAGDGPSWVAAVVNAVGESQFWDSTAIFVQWDDWGGFYDEAPPQTLDFDGLGFRVPLLVISPYAKQNYVSHTPYETASVLRFAEDTFGLAPLARADRRATSPAADCFDFSQPPRTFVPIQAQRV